MASAAFDCISEGGSSLTLANVLAKVPIWGKRLMVSRLTPSIPGMFEKFPGGVGLVRTYIGSAHEKDADGVFLVYLIFEAYLRMHASNSMQNVRTPVNAGSNTLSLEP